MIKAIRTHPAPAVADDLIVVTHGPEAPHRAPGAFLFAQQAAAMGSNTAICFGIVQEYPEDLIDETDTLVGPSFLITRGLASDLVLSF